MNKEQLKVFLEKQTKRFTDIYGGEVVRHASPSQPDPIKLGAFHKVPNLKEAEWQEYLEQLRNGTYCPDTNFQVRPPSNRRVRLDD